MKVGITFNIKKDFSGQREVLLEKNKLLWTDDKNLTENYSHRLSDTFAEWDESETIEAVRSAIEKAGHEVILIEADENVFENLKLSKPDIVFNIAESFGGAARESYIPAMLEMLGIPYTASDPITIGICHDKSRCKEILSAYNIPTPKYFIAEGDYASINGIASSSLLANQVPDNEIASSSLQFPLFVKPLHEGSSKGIFNSSVVYSEEELKSELTRIVSGYSQPAMVEEYLPGREFTVSMFGNGDEVRILPIIEVNLACIPRGFHPVFSYEVKWFFDTRENKLNIYTCPAKIDEKLRKNIEEICLQAYKVLRIKDWARIDVRCDAQDRPYIIEANPLPGILPNPADNSCFPRSAAEAGIDYETLITNVLDLAITRYEFKHEKTEVQRQLC